MENLKKFNYELNKSYKNKKIYKSLYDDIIDFIKIYKKNTVKYNDKLFSLFKRIIILNNNDVIKPKNVKQLYSATEEIYNNLINKEKVDKENEIKKNKIAQKKVIKNINEVIKQVKPNNDFDDVIEDIKGNLMKEEDKRKKDEIKALNEISNKNLLRKLKDVKKLVNEDDDLLKDVIEQIKKNKLLNKSLNRILVENKNSNIKNKQHDFTNTDYKNLFTFHTNIYDNILKAKKAIYENNKNIYTASIKMITATIDIQKNKIERVSTDKAIEMTKDGKEIEKIKNGETDKIINSLGSGFINFYVGYNIIFINRPNKVKEGFEVLTTPKTWANLKAFNASNDRKFHELTTESTHNNKICIYESFLSVNEILSLKYRHENEKNKKEIFDMLKDEGEEIENAVKNGELINAITLLNISYGVDAYILFFNNNTALYIDEEGKLTEINKNEIEEETKIFLYDEGKKHVAPSHISYFEDKKDENLIKKSKLTKYILKNTIIKNETKPEELYNNCLCFDFETFNIDEVATPYCICLYGFHDYKEIKQSFYGLDCVKNFIEYLNKNIVVLLNHKITRPNKKVNYVKLYGFNNSKFDNIFIYKEFKKIDENTEYIFSGSSVKFIKYNNIEILDINLMYPGSLRDICKNLGFEKEKGIFPYKFVNKDNIYYNGDFPKIEYFNDFEKIEEYEQLKQLNNNIFDCKEYTLKYCFLDVELTYLLCKEHLKNSVGEINNKKFNISTCKTSAGASLKMFNQVFQNEELEGSPEHILIKEKKSYYGGRTEVFKQEFISKDEDDKLFYFDINSSYPYSMTKTMPNKYINTIQTKKIIKLEDIIDIYLYGVSSFKYVGNNKIVINNLLERNEKGLNISVLESKNKNHFWGVELKEAILNNFEIEIFEINRYEGKPLLKQFSNYFYNERLKVKKSNPSKALFYKLVMNSLYGKFGQRQFYKSALVNNDGQIWDILKDEFTIIRDINYIDDDNYLIEYEEKGDNFDYIGNLIRLSSYISACSRSHLSEVMRDIGHENIYYCDTDSIFTNKKPNDKYINDSILGKWKEEEESGIKEAYFLAPKLYYYKTFNDEESKKAKGINGKKIKSSDYHDLSRENIEDIEQGNTMFFRNLNQITIKDNQIRTIKKVLTKRIFNKNESYAFKNINEYNTYNS